jgi:hypothetical protein
MGQVLDDNALLKGIRPNPFFSPSLFADPIIDCRFSRDVANIAHITVKPQEPLEEEEMKQSKEGKTRGSGSRGGVNCCVIL